MQSSPGHRPDPEERAGTADDRISAAAAAEILGIDRDKVYRLMAKRRLPTYGGPHSYNQLRRSDIEQWRDRGEPIALTEAAKILRRSTDAVRELVQRGVSLRTDSSSAWARGSAHGGERGREGDPRTST
jgi:predicted HTH domain antitoxin